MAVAHDSVGQRGTTAQHYGFQSQPQSIDQSGVEKKPIDLSAANYGTTLVSASAEIVDYGGRGGGREFDGIRNLFGSVCRRIASHYDAHPLRFDRGNTCLLQMSKRFPAEDGAGEVLQRRSKPQVILG